MLEVRLIVLNAREPQAFLLRPPTVVIGRGANCDLIIRARDISRRHCLITLYADQVTIEDLNSTNGTFVNGQPITGSVPLKNGDLIRIGSAQLQVQIASPSGMSTAGPGAAATPVHPRAEVVDEEEPTSFPGTWGRTPPTPPRQE